jgi:hypothetical protein
MKRMTIYLALAFVIALLLIAGEPQTQPASAGGWPCFICHGGFEVPGTDLAPALAGSKLTDEQIIAQVRHPRGMMPAFSPAELSDQILKDGFIQPFVRGLPGGQPTATLSPEIRSMALATIAAVAAARATEYARPSQLAPTATATPVIVNASPTPSPTPATQTKSTAPNEAQSIEMAMWVGVLLITGAGLGWLWTRR